MRLEESLALVTGANRGLGTAFIDMVRGVQMPKTSPEDGARTTFEMFQVGQREGLVDDVTRQVRVGFWATPAVSLGGGA